MCFAPDCAVDTCTDLPSQRYSLPARPPFPPTTTTLSAFIRAPRYFNDVSSVIFDLYPRVLYDEDLITEVHVLSINDGDEEKLYSVNRRDRKGWGRLLQSGTQGVREVVGLVLTLPEDEV